MSKARERTDDDNGETLSRVTLENTVGQLRTFSGSIPFQMDGLHWQFLTDDTHRVRDVKGCTAVGSVDGEIRARGIVDNVIIRHNGAEVLVQPPFGGQVRPTHWL